MFVSDHIALVVGRIVMAWGYLDQSVYMAVDSFAAEKVYRDRKRTGDLPSEKIIADDRFAHRLKQMRQLLKEVAKDQSIFADFDRMKTKLFEVERSRAHMAHGIIYEQDGRVHVHDYRE